MINFFKKTLCFSVLTAALLLTACNKAETKPTAPTPATPAAQVAPTGPQYTAADFKADGVVLIPGKNYKQVASPQPVQVPGKIEVIEFFWYGCPHCYRMESMTQAWEKTLGPDVNFIRVPAFWGKPMDEHQKIFYTLAALKKNAELDNKVFHAIHEEGAGLAKPDLISEFMAKNGIDKATWEAAYNSFGVNTDIIKANALFKAYGLDGVPNFVINGKYVAGPSMTGESPETLKVINKLIEKERGTKK
ncbi:thiol:disulfide interchange protein DsbA/DsbL [Hydromonas duriensis]|uniref:Thiol:disulfide interchange protein DsbA n=1 Tax=Hydromonas duriensis TaxID=1527608 RepID=A0A4R6Y6S3_9BURK|nr:thiol:disulfide interchange protein DsbA/DsbL [Hydromonas duriensis]TDR30997.1 thiol:disulfide interchange protein DsbA [Hydromonas duriensis]